MIRGPLASRHAPTDPGAKPARASRHRTPAVTCRELIDFLGAYVDGELADAVRLRFDEHLAACPECSAYVEAYRVTIRLARDAGREPTEPSPAAVPEELVKAILSARGKR